MPIVTPKDISQAIQTSGSAKPPVTEPSRQPDTSVEPASDAGAALSPKEDKAQPTIADLARKEQALIKKMREIAAKEAEMKGQEPELQKKLEDTFKQSLKTRLSQDPLGFLEENGITTEQLTNLILNPRAPLPPEVIELREQLKAIKEAQENSLKAQEEQKSQAFQKAVEQIDSDVLKLVDSDERFETIKGMSSHKAVTELIVQTFETTGKLLSTEEAAQEVEEYLFAEALRVAELKKVKDRLKPQDPEPKSQASTGIKTLTNRVDQTPTRSLSAKERFERAVQIAKGELKPE